MKTINYLLVNLSFFLFLLGCNTNISPFDKEEANTIESLRETLPLIDISLGGEGRAASFVTHRNLYYSDIHGRNVIFRLYSDGTAIYSGDDLEAGPPYYTIKIPKDQIDAFFDEMKKHQIFEGQQWQFHAGPSASFIRIYINHCEQSIEWCSWHELAERNPNLVVTETGIAPLGDRDKNQVMESQSEEYKEFLSQWKLIRESIKNLIENPAG